MASQIEILLEKYASKIEMVYIPAQWYKHVRDAVTSMNGKIQVIEMNRVYSISKL